MAHGGKDVEARIEGDPTILIVVAAGILGERDQVFAFLIEEVPASGGAPPTVGGEHQQFVGAVTVDVPGPNRAPP